MCATPNARHFLIFREKLQRFRRRKFEKSTPQTQKFGFKNECFAFLNEAHNQTKMCVNSKCDLLRCATPKTRDRRILRGKLQRFRCRKFEKSAPHMQKIGGNKACAHFETQCTTEECACAME